MSITAQEMIVPPSRKRRTSVTVRRSQIDVPDPKERPSSSGRFVAVEIPEGDLASRPGPVSRWLVLTLIAVGACAVVGYAWERSNAGIPADPELLRAVPSAALPAPR